MFVHKNIVTSFSVEHHMYLTQYRVKLTLALIRLLEAILMCIISPIWRVIVGTYGIFSIYKGWVFCFVFFVLAV